LEVPDEVFDVRGAAHVAAVLLYLRDAAQAAKGGGTRLGRGQSTPEIVFDFLIEMKSQLTVELLLDGAALR
jgi:hypothetical protein